MVAITKPKILAPLAWFLLLYPLIHVSSWIISSLDLSGTFIPGTVASYILEAMYFFACGLLGGAIAGRWFIVPSMILTAILYSASLSFMSDFTGIPYTLTILHQFHWIAATVLAGGVGSFLGATLTEVLRHRTRRNAT